MGSACQWKVRFETTFCVKLSNFQFDITGLNDESVDRYHEYKSAESCFKYKLEKCGPEYREMSMAALHYLRKGCHVTSSLCREGILFQFLVRAMRHDQ